MTEWLVNQDNKTIERLDSDFRQGKKGDRNGAKQKTED